MAWLQRFWTNDIISRQLIIFLIHLCLQQLRIDTILSLKNREVKENNGNDDKAVVESTEPFTHASVSRLIKGPPKLTDGNRGHRPDPPRMFNILFGEDGSFSRPRWQDKAFRALYKTARTALSTRFQTKRLKKDFDRNFIRHLCAYHWILPYPATDAWANYTKIKNGVPP